MPHITLFLLVIVGVALRRPSASITAQLVTPHIQVRQVTTGVHVTFTGSGVAMWPRVEIGGLAIPAQLVVVGNAHNTPAPLLSSTLDCRTWVGQRTPSPRPIPEVDGQAHLDLGPPQATTLPTAPISLLREGQYHGQQL